MSGLDWLVCPHCRQPLVVADRMARCASGHSIDMARQGYLNLLGRAQGRNADTPDMVESRGRFLASGAYDPIARTLVDHLPPDASAVVEVGAGTGWYLAQALDARPDAEGLGIDVSVPAAKRLARCHPRASAVVADAWQPLPLADACADVVLSVFAPRNPEEFVRILRPGGVVVTVTPRPGHLASARERLGLLEVEPDKDRRLDETLGRVLSRGHSDAVDVDLVLSPEQLADLVGMGPNAFHDHATPEAGISTRAEVSVTSWAHSPH